MKMLGCVLVLAVLVAVPVTAADIVVTPEPIQVNGLAGSIGVGVGLYWPAIQVPKYDVTLGPMLALGDESLVGGGGLQLPLSIQAPVLDRLNFLWIGYSYNWTEDSWEPEAGIGLVVDVR